MPQDYVYSVVFPLAPGGRGAHRTRFAAREDAEAWIAYACRWFGPWELYELSEDCASLIDHGDG